MSTTKIALIVLTTLWVLAAGVSIYFWWAARPSKASKK